ncbi:MAG: hypothetical protein OJF61_002756 [Rhodanobacteraceae bacterium]|jgi:hypothetical protein|nr:MAG: hypothetical protein OJF61_002756 [Rhodanobacteraceae bacterium]
MKVLDLDAGHYTRHVLHADDRVWVEKNCYVDIWIELIHTLGCEPLAMLPFVNAIDFVGDQWTFFKPRHDELRALYGIDVQELNCWRPLIEHAEEHLSAGRLIATEADAWWLPDVTGTDYRTQHTKSSIILNDLDARQRTLGYFHNAGYFKLDGEDFARTFRLDMDADPAFMPFYAELVAIDALQRLGEPELRARSAELLAKHSAEMPRENPVERFGVRFQRDLPALQDKGLAYYHAWAFATVRQLGAAAELSALHLRWLDPRRHAAAADAWDRINHGAKTFILKAARAVNSRRALDTAAYFDEWAQAWQTARDALSSG